MNTAVEEIAIAINGDKADAHAVIVHSLKIIQEIILDLVAKIGITALSQVKRNVELELEAVHALQAQGVPIRHGNEDGNASGDEVRSGAASVELGH